MRKKYFGIAGFGIAGQSILRFYKNFYVEFSNCLSQYSQDDSTEIEWLLKVFDEKSLNEKQKQLLLESNVSIETDVDTFLEAVDLVWFSTGIDINRFSLKKEKIIKEVDIFHMLWKKPIIGITGTIGKTTLTQLLYELFMIDSCASYEGVVERSCTHLRGCSYQRVALGGNIGVGLLDLVPHQPLYRKALLELSSWQLEESNCFSPDIGIWMNLYDNHLDRHGSKKQYFRAKSMFLRHQKKGDIALLGSSLIEGENKDIFVAEISKWQADLFIIFDRAIVEDEKVFLNKFNCSYVSVENEQVVLHRTGSEKQNICLINLFNSKGFLDTWIFSVIALFFSGVTISMLTKEHFEQAYNRCRNVAGQHRLELCAEKNALFFYNDSKSTVPYATQAAITHLKQQHEKIILITGGLNKGADRSDLITFVEKDPSIKLALRFGPGSVDLEPLEYFDTLDSLLQEAVQRADPGDAILFSPSGSSFDLYENYKKRGDHFIQLVQKL
ncbi:hypothetical protein JKY79_02540 [Candidatus Babeliales bacterium]|nr:hypothetical protein [Candidatus Babeliales bacterium]